MDMPSAFNYLLGVTTAVLAWVARQLHTELRDVKKDFNALSLLVVGDYVHKDQLHELKGELFKKLDRIEDKLDAKIDKPNEH